MSSYENIIFIFMKNRRNKIIIFKYKKGFFYTSEKFVNYVKRDTDMIHIII